jgi:hypothetical protein
MILRSSRRLSSRRPRLWTASAQARAFTEYCGELFDWRAKFMTDHENETTPSKKLEEQKRDEGRAVAVAPFMMTWLSLNPGDDRLSR